MSSGQSLALYRELIPKLSMPGRRRKFTDSDVAYQLLNALETITIFDCRALPIPFVDDTGDAVLEEMHQTRELVHLAFDRCYFEFADEPRMIYAEQLTHYIGDVDKANEIIARGRPSPDAELYKYRTEAPDTGIGVHHLSLPDPTLVGELDLKPGDVIGREIEVYDLAVNAMFNGVCGSFFYGAPGPIGIAQQKVHDKVGMFSIFNDNQKLTGEHWNKVGKRVLAVAVLLSERLLLNDMKPDPTPKISHMRRRIQKPPISGDIHVLTINVPIVRYQASRNTPQGGTHESPPLHWRRGHQRVYHRGTNFESTGWVSRCLVGDPAKGYVQKTQYRLVHQPAPLRVIQGGRR